MATELSSGINIETYTLVTNMVACGAAGGGGILAWQQTRQRRRSRAWTHVAERLGLALRTIRHERTPRLSGIYRGRAVEAGFTNGAAQANTLALNPAHIIDIFSSDDNLPDAPWLAPSCRETLCALRDMGRHWTVQVEGRIVRLSCAMPADTPDQLRFLLDLSCDLAEGVDNPYPSSSQASACLASRSYRMV